MYICALWMLFTAQMIKSELVPPNTSAVACSTVDSSSPLTASRETCGALCQYNADYNIAIATEDQNVTYRWGTSSIPVITVTYIVYHGYSMTTDSTLDGSRAVAKETSYSLKTPFTYINAHSVELSEAYTTGMSSFSSFLGLARNCQTRKVQNRIKRAAQNRRAIGTSQPSLGVQPNHSSAGAPILNTGEKAAIGVVVPFSIIAIIAAAFVFWRLAKRRRQRNSSTSSDYNEKKSTGPQPFLQIKGEFLGEDNRHEMPAEERIYELQGEASMHELGANKSGQEERFNTQTRELEGEGFARELNVER